MNVPRGLVTVLRWSLNLPSVSEITGTFDFVSKAFPFHHWIWTIFQHTWLTSAFYYMYMKLHFFNSEWTWPNFVPILSWGSCLSRTLSPGLIQFSCAFHHLLPSCFSFSFLSELLLIKIISVFLKLGNVLPIFPPMQ